MPPDETQKKLRDLRVSFSPKLPTSVLVSILGRLGKKAAERAALVKRDVVGTAKALGMYSTKLLSVAVGGSITAIATVDGVFTCGGGKDEYGRGKGIALGHGGGAHAKELALGLVEVLVGKNVVGVTAGSDMMAVWTKTGELFTFGRGADGKLGLGEIEDGEHEYVPRLVETPVGTKVVAAAVVSVTQQGGTQNELVPRLIEALQLVAGKKVVGAATESHQTAVWTDTVELLGWETMGGWAM